jgi:hypothetical protein
VMIRGLIRGFIRGGGGVWYFEGISKFDVSLVLLICW